MLLFAIVSTVPCVLVLSFPAIRAIRRRERPPEDDEVPDGRPELLEPEPKLARAS